MPIFNMLPWQDTGDIRAPVAIFGPLGSTAGVQFSLCGYYLNRNVYAASVVIDNTGSTTELTWQVGPETILVPPYQRIALAIARGSLLAQMGYTGAPGTGPVYVNFYATLQEKDITGKVITA